MKNRQVVFLMTDTTRKDMLGCYGDSRMITPNLDKLAAEGIRFDKAYTCQPVCGPARSAIFTGLFPHSNGSVANSVALGDNVKTIGQRLNDNGINCGYIGKWHLDGSDYFGNGVCPQGWNKKYWYDMRTYLEEFSDEDRLKSRKPDSSFEPWMTAEFTYAHRCSNRAIDFLNENRDKSFFLAVSYDEPHGPFLCPAPYNTMYKDFQIEDNPAYHDDLANKPMMQKLWAGNRLGKSSEELRRGEKHCQLYYGCNSFVDSEIGRVIDRVNQIVPDALVIFTSDHGDMMGAHCLSSKNATAYKETANIPLIIRGGEKGKVVNDPCSHIDMVPTIMDYMGLPLPKVLEGKSMLPQIYDTKKKTNSTVFFEFTRYEIDHDTFGGLQMMRAAVSDRYKMAIYLLDTDEFYDMENDPYEVHNLINDEKYSAARDKLHDEILAEMDRTRDLYRGYQWACRPWRKDKKPNWRNSGLTRQRENEEYEPRQLDYNTGLPMVEASRGKG
ncbi:MAG: sulfatase-like hydrolase/transferase [Treponema sp.]|nr:sulfatase-like hydrolase/transferase [Treponema sp.]